MGFSNKNWYIHVWQDNADYCAELGVRCGGDHFIPLIRSNIVRTPPKSASKRNDLIWQDIKAHKESQPYIKENIKERHQSIKHQAIKERISIERSRKGKDLSFNRPGHPRLLHETFCQGVQKRQKKSTSSIASKNILKGKLRGISLAKSQAYIDIP